MAFTASDDNTVRLWNAATGEPIGKPLWHRLHPNVVVFTADCTRVLTGDEAGVAQFWDVQTGAPVGAPQLHLGPVRGLAISSDGDSVLSAASPERPEWDRGNIYQLGGIGVAAFDESLSQGALRLAMTPLSGHVHGEISFWDAATGERRGLPVMNDAPLVAAAFSPDGTKVVAGSVDNTARQWEIATGKPVGDRMRHDGAVVAVAFSPNGRFILTGSEDRSARIWEAAGGTSVAPPLYHQASVRAVAYDPDGKTFVTASKDGRVQLWNSSGFTRAGEPIRQGAVTAVAFSRDGKLIVTAGEDALVRVFGVENGAPGPVLRATNPEQRWSLPVLGVAVSPDAQKVAFAGGRPSDRTHWALPRMYIVGGFARVQSLKPDHALLWEYTWNEAFMAIAYRPDGEAVVAANEWEVRIRSAKTGEPIGSPLEHRGCVRAVAFSPDGRLVLTAGSYGDRRWDRHRNEPMERQPFRGELRYWNQATGALVGTIPLPFLRAAGFGRDGQSAVFVASSRLSFASARTIIDDHDQPVVAPGVRRIANPGPIAPGPIGCEGQGIVFSQDGTARLVARDARAEIMHYPGAGPGDEGASNVSVEHRATIRAGALSRDGHVALTAGDDRAARLWDGWTGKPIADPLLHPLAVNCAALSADARIALTGCDDGVARLWEVASSKQLGVALVHQSAVRAVAFGLDGKSVLTGCEDGQARLWNAGIDSGAAIRLGAKSATKFLAASFSPDGELVVTGSDDGSLRIWELRIPASPWESLGCTKSRFMPWRLDLRATRSLPVPGSVRGSMTRPRENCAAGHCRIITVSCGQFA